MNNFPKGCDLCRDYVANNQDEWKKHRLDQHNVGGTIKIKGLHGKTINERLLCNGCGIKRVPVFRYDTPRRGTVNLCQICRDKRKPKKRKDALDGAITGSGFEQNKRKH